MELIFGPSTQKSSKREYDAIVIGAGPAGLTAAIYLARAKLSTLILEKLVPGGLAATTDKIENYPGFPEGIGGEELTSRMEKQAVNFGVDIALEEVLDVDFLSNPKVIKTSDSEYTGRGIIIATGTSPRSLNVPGEQKFRGKGISYCATCDAPFFQDKEVVVIGCGNSGIQEGIYLKKFAKKITFVEFLPHMTAEKVLQERVRALDNVEFLLNHQVTAFEGEEKLTGVRVKNRETGEEFLIPADGAFVYVGLKPNTEFLKGKVEMDEYGFIKTDEKLKTSIPGVYAAGDVRTTMLRQVATAVGDGALAAKLLEEELGG
ncbi:thioredoxin-disulfide reductase [bacterium]|nr:MAG: thioredoxin-disulfide reductase [bacterium]RKZ22618.1 MAG: thioredoxin-disulfide reductase [bacterium]